MLTIAPCLEKETVVSYCKKCRKVYSAAFYLYLAENRGETLAAGLFQVDSDSVQVVYYEGVDPADHFLFDGVLRAGLNYAAEHGIQNGLIPEEFRHTHRELFSQLTYPIHAQFDITNFFQKYKNCGGQ